MNTDKNKAVIARIDALGNGDADLAELDEFCQPNVVNHALAPNMPAGIEGTRRFLERARRDQHPARWTWSALVAENDYVVQFGEREHHWPGGSFRGFDTAPGIVRRDCAFAYRLVDGRLAERWAIRDDLSMLIQLGAIIPPSDR
jgi:predicted ester cyclase